MKLVVLANPENRRVAFFQAALARAGLAPATVVAWHEHLERPSILDEALSRSPGRILRIESPGENDHVERLLIARGADEPDDDVSGDDGAARIGREAALALPADKGRILYPRQWYLGFRAALRALPPARFMNGPRDIAIAFDKRACQERFHAAGVPIPARLPRVRAFDELRPLLARKPRVFVKLASGSSASGVIALASAGPRLRAWTTVEREGDKLYNSLRVRTLTEEGAIVPIVDAILREGAQVEEWVPKLGLDGSPCDLRLVVIAGRARHAVVRLGKGPLTNLHLGNRRGDLARLIEKIGPRAFEEARATAVRAAAVFGETLYAGIDLVVSTTGRLAVLEINAFGDLLPNVLDAEGRDTYAAEVAALGQGVPA